ncbi:protein PXR1-like isoform X2 [Belonocnema kinseyi]|uniref:protein PXR1-like isoform X2 n=1 Tax=Belonocnema kinseyi TaxID=2817044 RepID=UPI00143DB9B0|nr:protein PXR1-like isoform X2 [Belonocnema kinseyi]
METEICEISDSKEDSKLQDLPSKKKKTKRCISAEKIASTNEEVKDLKQSGKERHIIKRKSDQFEINQSSISEYDKKRKRKKHEPSELEPTAVQQSSDEVNVQKEKKKRKSDRSLEKDTANLKSGSLVTGEGDSEVSIKNTCQNLSGKKGSDLQDKYGQDLPEELINPCKDGL